MSDRPLPEPMTPSFCDLRGYDYMPLIGQRLFQSRFYALSLRNPRAGLAGLKLFWIAWLECPAGSLPDDDDYLATVADFGTDMRGWRAARAVALHGFVKCSDGRLYHPMVCHEAVKAFSFRLSAESKRDADRERLRRWRERRTAEAGEAPDGEAGNDPETLTTSTDDTRVETTDETRFKTRTNASRHVDRRGRQDKTGQDKERELPSVAPRASRPPARDSGSRLPESWVPDDAGHQFAVGLGLEPNAVLAIFSDHYRSRPGRGGLSTDWSLTWRNWCRREVIYAAKPGRVSNGSVRSEAWDQLAAARGYRQ